MCMRYTGKWKMNKAAGRRYGSGISMVSQIMERKKVQRRRGDKLALVGEVSPEFVEGLESSDPPSSEELKEKMQDVINNSNLTLVCGRW